MTDWLSHKSCTHEELELLIRTLQHACKVIHPGQCFLRHTITRLSLVSQSHHHIRLNTEFRSELLWWKTFAVHWNGDALPYHGPNPPSLKHGHLGCFGVVEPGTGTNGDQSTQDKQIAVKSIFQW